MSVFKSRHDPWTCFRREPSNPIYKLIRLDGERVDACGGILWYGVRLRKERDHTCEERRTTRWLLRSSNSCPYSDKFPPILCMSHLRNHLVEPAGAVIPFDPGCAHFLTYNFVIFFLLLLLLSCTRVCWMRPTRDFRM